jgi:hypothetical protein
MIPQNLRPFFWDIDADSFDPKRHPDYTIARILEYGNREALSWIKGLFSENEITRILRTERRLTRKSATFWALVYHLSPDQVSALKMPDVEGIPEHTQSEVP